MKPCEKFISPPLLSEMDAKSPILLALSGGADSRALLHMLADFCKKQGAPLSVAHVNHMIRGKDAERDRDFCKRLANDYGAHFYLLEADVPALARQNHRGLEEEARAVRYGFFEKIMRENGISILATAHNATDNAETVIFNLTRGSGLKGLCGIPPVRSFEGGKIIRPLIKMSKAEILAYCNENKLEYVSDSTNSDVTYSRNRIRSNIIPELEKINESAIENISRMSDFARCDDALLEGLARDFIESLTDSHKIPANALLSLDKPIRTRVASLVLGKFFQVSSVHVEAFMELAQRQVPHSRLDMPEGVSVSVDNGSLCISHQKEKERSFSYDMQIKMGQNPIPELDMLVLAESTENSGNGHLELKNIYKKSIHTTISSDKIYSGLFIRTKRDGDKILCGGIHKKLKKLFCEKKLPLDMRAKLPIFYDNEGILWVPLIAKRDGERNDKSSIQITLFYN